LYANEKGLELIIDTRHIGSVFEFFVVLAKNNKAVTNRDVNDVANIAHRLKGSAANLHGEQLTAHLTELELASMNGDISISDKIMKKINASSLIFLKELRSE